MKRAVLSIAGILLLSGSLAAQAKAPARRAPQRSTKAAAARPAAADAEVGEPERLPADAQIAAAMKEVSATHIRAAIEKLVSFGNRNTLGSADTEMAAKGQGVVAAREWIKAEFERYAQACSGCLEVKTDSFTQPKGGRIPQPTELSNIYAVQRGSDPDAAARIVLVTGHYDSIGYVRSRGTASVDEPPTAPGAPAAPLTPEMLDYKLAAPGANDDGSGTAVSLECARVLSKHKFPATIIYLTVPGEEQGLNGSAHFARMAKDEKWELVAALNNDIVGGNRTPGNNDQNPSIVRVFSEGMPLSADLVQARNIRRYGWENDSSSRQLARYIRLVGRTYMTGGFGPKLVFRADRFGRGGDHTSFNQQGFASVRFTEYAEDLNHQHQVVRTENGIEYGDLPKFVDFDYVANVARLNAATLASLASAPPPPTNVRIDMRAPGNSTTLTWEAPKGAPSAEFEVLWRATTAPEWEHIEKAGSATKATLPHSKDNVMFAVRSIDKQGHRSLPIIPRPNRERPPTYEGEPPARTPATQPPAATTPPGIEE